MTLVVLALTVVGGVIVLSILDGVTRKIAYASESDTGLLFEVTQDEREASLDEHLVLGSVRLAVDEGSPCSMGYTDKESKSDLGPVADAFPVQDVFSGNDGIKGLFRSRLRCRTC